jgi:hypothetical protein
MAISPRYRILLAPILMLSFLFVAFLLALRAAPARPLGPGRFPDARDVPPKNWILPVFHLSQDYPKELPPERAEPWMSIDFTTDHKEYMKAVLKYAYEDNVFDGEWRPERNTNRLWYHAPWLHWGDKGREFIHGLTRERRSRPCELSNQQHDERQNWAVSVYNEPGGYVIGRVWANPSAPNPAAANFPVGTVAVKLLFTAASSQEVPYLLGSPEWDANIESRPGEWPGVREKGRLRLLQVDFAVRDKRANSRTGWVFGTFQYDVAAKGDGWYKELVPVALTWGNDEGIGPDDVKPGGKILAERWINDEAPIVKHRNRQRRSLGWAGRANGPVDSQDSACLSCHSTAQYPSFANLTFSKGASLVEKLRWFRNLKPGDAFSPESHSLNYSLQLAGGIQNFYQWVESVQNQQDPVEVVSPPADRILNCDAVPRTAGSSPMPASAESLSPSDSSEPRLLTIYPVSRDGEEGPLKVLSVPESPPEN